MTIGARCGSCNRELLLVQLLMQLAQPSQDFHCPFCSFAFAPTYTTIAPGMTNQAIAAHQRERYGRGVPAPLPAARFVNRQSGLLVQPAAMTA